MKKFSDWEQTKDAGVHHKVRMELRYDNMYRSTLEKYGVGHVSQLTVAEMADFFRKLNENWQYEQYLNESEYDAR